MPGTSRLCRITKDACEQLGLKAFYDHDKDNEWRGKNFIMEHRLRKLWASHRLRRLGFDQWQYPVKWENIRSSATDRNLWLVTTSHGKAIGTLIVEQKADHYWLPSDNPDDALYAHRMVVDDGCRGTS